VDFERHNQLGYVNTFCPRALIGGMGHGLMPRGCKGDLWLYAGYQTVCIISLQVLAACGRDVMPSIYSTDTPLSDVAQSLHITPVQCFTILSYVSRRRTTPAVYYRSSKFCAVPSASRVSALLSAPAVSPAPGCFPAGFGPGGLGTGGIMIVSVVCAPAVSLRWSGPAGPIISDPAISDPLPPQHTPI
jgi:hypothetical protein